MVCILSSAITAHVGDATFMVIGRGYARVAVGARVGLAGGHEDGEGWVG